jgi:hypothetical protein
MSDEPAEGTGAARSVDERVRELLDRIRAGALPRNAPNSDDLNEERVEEFIRALGSHPRRSRLTVTRQVLPWWARRTTRYNYVFEVEGRRPDLLVLVAHYDTWGGPGADDNTTGEEILKQYLLADLDAPEAPALTRRYLLAGSEECGLIGFASQILVTFMIWAASIALTTGDPVAAAVGFALTPSLLYRFGVSGSRVYARSLTEDELARIRAVVSVDSVGEGKLYIPATTLGAEFLRALVPYSGSDHLDDALKEIAHLHGISYNTHLAGGTTDHLSFLEINRSLRRGVYEAGRRAACALRGRPYRPPLTVPASALVAMAPGKASPFVLGGKIHTRHDTADRVYEKPLRETLLILDGLIERLDGGARPRQPRRIEDCHYLRLYALGDGRWVAALKDAVEPNRRNVNLLVSGRYDPAARVFDAEDVLDWGNEVRLGDEIAEFAAAQGVDFEDRTPSRLRVRQGTAEVAFERRARPARAARAWFGLLGGLQTLLGRFSFLAMFGAAWLVGTALAAVFLDGLLAWPATREFLSRHLTALFVAVVALQLLVLVRLYTRSFPTWMDNAYKNLNRSDNLGSLRRAAGERR